MKVSCFIPSNTDEGNLSLLKGRPLTMKCGCDEGAGDNNACCCFYTGKPAEKKEKEAAIGGGQLVDNAG